MSNYFETPWTVAHQTPLSIGFPRQEYWSRLPFPITEYLPDPGIEPKSPAWQAESWTTEPPGKPIQREKRETEMLIDTEIEVKTDWLGGIGSHDYGSPTIC